MKHGFAPILIVLFLFSVGILGFVFYKFSYLKPHTNTVPSPIDDKTLTSLDKNDVINLITKPQGKVYLSWEEKLNDDKYTHGIYLLDLETENSKPKKLIDEPDFNTQNYTHISAPKFTTNGDYAGWLRSGRSNAGSRIEYVKSDQIGQSKPQVIEHEESSYVNGFVWSPDGSQIAISERFGNSSKFSYRIKVFDTKTSHKTNEFPIDFSKAESSPDYFSWSTNNKFRFIVRTGVPLPAEEYSVMSYSVDGKKEFENLIYSVESNQFRPNFDISDDGEHIAYVKKFKSGTSYQGELWHGNMDGSSLRKIADTLKERCSNASTVAIAPNGNYALVGSACGDDNSKIINIKNGNAKSAEVSTFYTSWSPESNQVWVIASNNTNYILNLEGKIIKEFNLDFWNVGVTWSP